MTAPPVDSHVMNLIRMAVREDLGPSTKGTRSGDRTVEASIPPGEKAVGTIVARRPGVIAGTFLLPVIWREYVGQTSAGEWAGDAVEILTADGEAVAAGQPVARFRGSAGTLLTAERVMLNFLCRLSGVASLTRRYVDAVASVTTPRGKPPLICDTRKTTPGFRSLEKYAVRCGGGTNHRMGLYDGVMLKDNHLAALRGQLGRNITLYQLTARIRRELPAEVPLWLEVDSLDQLGEALQADTEGGGWAGADIILLDNMRPELMRSAVAMRDKVSHQSERPLLEASGGITLENIAAFAATGVERISIGALTHSAAALDLSMEMA